MVRTNRFIMMAAGGALVCGITAAAGAGIGNKYETREPHTCPSRTEPARGAISAAQAKQYFICDDEIETASSIGGHTLHLVTNVTVQVGAGRRFLLGSDDTDDNVKEGIDPQFTVYPIRGSFVQWSCSEISEFSPRGKNCSRQEMPRATGICFVSSFKEWHCNMQDISQPAQTSVAGPKTD